MFLTGTSRRRSRVLSLVITAMLLGACGSDAATNGENDAATNGENDAATSGQNDAATSGENNTANDTYTLEMRLTPSNAAFAIAQDKGLFDGIELDYTRVGIGESAALFLAGEQPVGQESAWEAARYRSEGEDIVFIGTPSALAFFNGLVIRAEDADVYQSLTDLKGKKVGHPGFGTGTWAAFEIIAKSIYGMDPRSDFELVEGGPGALLGLLTNGEIDATLNFTGQTATALSRPEEFKVLINFTEEWERDHGQPLTINGLLARGDWIKENEDVARRLVEGVERGLEWMKENPDAFREGGEYADFAAEQGWLVDEATNDKVIEMLLAGDYYLSADTYTDEWIDSMYSFIQEGQGILAEKIPPKDEIFYPPEKLSG